MISTERLAEIKSTMEAKLPLETHGENAFDPVTRILVSDIHGMLELIEHLHTPTNSVTDSSASKPFQYQITLEQALAEFPTMPTEYKVDLAEKVLAALDEDDRQTVFMGLMHKEQDPNQDTASQNSGIDPAATLDAGDHSGTETQQNEPAAGTFQYQSHARIIRGDTFPPSQGSVIEDGEGSDIASTGTVATALAGESQEKSEDAGTNNPPEQKSEDGSGSTASGVDPAAASDGSNTLRDADNYSSAKPTADNPGAETHI